MFRQVEIKHYWEVLHEGQRQHGRIIILEDKDDNDGTEQMTMTFVKFINLPAKKINGL